MEYDKYIAALEKHDVDVVVFDLGGVLVEVDPPTAVAADDCYLPEMEIINNLCAEVPEVIGFETGNVSAEEFGEAVVAKFELPLTVADFLSRYKDLIRRAVPTMQELVRDISDRYSVCCLSNTNPLHWTKVGEITNYCEFFDQVFLSYELGLVKPDIRIFRRMLQELEVAPEKVMFFDDKAENVEAARQSGFCAMLVTSIAEATLPG